MKTKEQIIEAAWNALQTAPLGQPDEVPEGWVTAFEVSKRINQSLTNARLKLKAQVAKGAFEEKKFRIPCHGELRRVYHYRPKT